MKDSLSKYGIALATCVIQLILVKFGEFAFAGLIVIFLLIGGLMVLMGHKSFGWGIITGTIAFTLILLLFGWTFMEGWPGPQEFMNGKRFQKQ